MAQAKHVCQCGAVPVDQRTRQQVARRVSRVVCAMSQKASESQKSARQHVLCPTTSQQVYQCDVCHQVGRQPQLAQKSQAPLSNYFVYSPVSAPTPTITQK